MSLFPMTKPSLGSAVLATETSSLLASNLMETAEMTVSFESMMEQTGQKTQIYLMEHLDYQTLLPI